jgi:two-component system response regulator AtoC
VIERAMILCDGDRVTMRDLPGNVVSPPEPGGAEAAGSFNLKRARRSAEVEAIRRALRATGGNRTHAARLLEISHRALLYKLKEYGIRD